MKWDRSTPSSGLAPGGLGEWRCVPLPHLSERSMQVGSTSVIKHANAAKLAVTIKRNVKGSPPNTMTSASACMAKAQSSQLKEIGINARMPGRG